MRRSLILVPMVAAFLGACSGAGASLPLLPGPDAARFPGEPAGADADIGYVSPHYQLAAGVTTSVNSAKAYKFDGPTSSAAVQKLADALGVKGALKETSGRWTVGDPAGKVVTTTGGDLHVNRVDGSFLMSWMYPLGDTPVPAAAAPTNADAIRIATDALAAGGVEVPDPKITVESQDGYTNVEFRPRIDGHMASGYEMIISLSGTTIQAADGFLGSLRELGSYGLVTPKQAVDRLNEMSGVVAPRSPGAQGDASTSTARTVTLTDAHVGLTTQIGPGERLWLVPVYDFTLPTGGVAEVQAAADKYILPPPPPTVTSPTTNPTTTTTGVPPTSVTSAKPKVPATTTTVAAAAGKCSAVTADNAGDNQGIAAKVCVDSASVKVGDTVVFRITATDPDRPFSDICGGDVREAYGDDGPGDIHCDACAATVSDGPGNLSTERSHIYDKSGTYTAKFTIRSGAVCGQSDPHDSTATVSIPITVT